MAEINRPHLGPCDWCENEGEVCGAPASKTVVVRTPSTRARVRLCPTHLSVHNEQAAARRTSKSRQH